MLIALSSSFALPARLGDTGDVAVAARVHGNRSADAELPDVAPGPAAAAATVVGPHLELGLAAWPWRSMISWPKLNSSLAPERHAEQLQQLPAFLVVLRRGHDGDVHAPRLVDLVVVDLRERSTGPSGPACSRPCRSAGSDTPRKSRIRGSATLMNRSRNSHMRSSRRVTRAPMCMPSRSLKFEMDLRALRLDGLLAGDGLQIAHARSRGSWDSGRLAQAHVDHDLHRPRDLHGARVARTSPAGPGRPPARNFSRSRGLAAAAIVLSSYRPLVVQHLAALLADASAAAVGQDVLADAGRLARVGADQHHVGGVDRAFLLDDPALGDILAGPRVALDQVDLLDDDPVRTPGRPSGPCPPCPCRCRT